MPCVESSSTHPSPCSSAVEESHAAESPEAPSTHSAAPAGSTDSDSIEEYKPGPHDNAWVQRCRHTEKGMDDTGTALMTAADAHGEKAEEVQKEHDARAHQAWSEGHYFQATKEKVTGQAEHDLERIKQAGDVIGAAAVATGEGAVQVARGDKDQVRKVAIGAAVVAAIPSGGTSLAAVLSAYGVTEGVGGMLRASNRNEFAYAAVETALAAMGPMLTAKFGMAVKNGMSAAELAEPLEQAFAEYAAKEAPEWAAQFGAEAGERFTQVVTQYGPWLVEKAIEHAAHHGLEAGVEKLARFAFDIPEEDSRS